jgi:DNA-directed RNA polymerase subunit RPC12/RpoP
MINLINRDDLIEKLLETESDEIENTDFNIGFIEAINTLIDLLYNAPVIHTNSILNSATNDIVRIIEDTPEITTRHGYWKAITESEISGWDVSLTGGYDPIALYVCSECGEDNIIDEFGDNFLPKYCPFCGARLMNNYMEDDNDE